MDLRKIKLGIWTVIGSLALSESSLARDASCEYMSASLVTIDSLYGMGLGALAGGLFIAASGRDEDVEQKLATSALTGLGVGFGFGLYEVASRDCKLRVSQKVSELPEGPFFTYNPLNSQWSLTMQLNF